MPSSSLPASWLSKAFPAMKTLFDITRGRANNDPVFEQRKKFGHQIINFTLYEMLSIEVLAIIILQSDRPLL
jgi:hypothetical protein